MGSYKYNMKLSGQRARAIFNYLVNKGIKPGRMVIKAYGYTKSIASNETEEGRQKNRRVVAVITARMKEYKFNNE